MSSVLHIQTKPFLQMIRQITMKSTCLLILASVVVCNLVVCGGQGIPDEDELDRMAVDDIILRRAEGLLLQSILRKMQSEDGRSGVYIYFPIFSPPPPTHTHIIIEFNVAL